MFSESDYKLYDFEIQYEGHKNFEQVILYSYEVFASEEAPLTGEICQWWIDLKESKKAFFRYWPDEFADKIPMTLRLRYPWIARHVFDDIEKVMECKRLSFHTKDDREYYRHPIFQKVGEGLYIQDREEYSFLKRGWKIKSSLGRLRISEEMPIWQHEADHCHVVWKILSLPSRTAISGLAREKYDKEIEDDLRNVIKNSRTNYGRLESFLDVYRKSDEPGDRDFENALSRLEEIKY